MSIKRTKQTSFRSRSDRDVPATIGFGKPPEPEKSWEEYTAGQPDTAFVPYSPKQRFEKGALILHAKFGKGMVLSSMPSNIDVVFAEGKKKLGHGLA